MYTLGVTLSIVAFGIMRQPPPESKRSAAESRLVELIAGLTARSPEARLTLEHAFLNPLLASVRLVNGVPVETMLATIFDKVAEDGSQQPQGGAWFTATHQQSSSSGNGAALMLQKFISECGPKFQVVSTSTSCTLYSVKHDPRRRAASMSSSASPTSPVPT
jgi:hypothetical protein